MESHPIKEIRLLSNSLIAADIPQGAHEPHSVLIAKRFDNYLEMYIYHNGIKLRVQFTKENFLTLANLIGEKNGTNKAYVSTDCRE